MPPDTVNEQNWISVPEEGRVYYFNKITGKSQWDKPVELGGISQPNIGQDFPTKARPPPPKPKTASKPPPRPKQTTAVHKSVKSDNDGAATMKVDVVKEMMFSGGQAGMRDPLKLPDSSDTNVVDPDTGFGGWEDVVTDVVTEEKVVLTETDIFKSMKDDARYTEKELSVPAQPIHLVLPSSPVSFKSVVRGPKKPRQYMVKVFVGSDHGGVVLKDQLILMLKTEFADSIVEDFGTYGSVAVDYPNIAAKVANAVAFHEGSFGIVVCGSGIGVSIAANKINGIRCALIHDHYTARMAREHNDANMIALGERVTGSEVAKDCVRTFLQTEFQGGRHANRVSLIMGLEK